jgi:hypothetical protein
MTTKFIRFTQRARALVRERFNSLMGLMCDAEGLRESFARQAKDKAPAARVTRPGSVLAMQHIRSEARGQIFISR